MGQFEFQQDHYITKFTSTADYETFTTSDDFIQPNVSLITKMKKVVKYSPLFMTVFEKTYDILYADNATGELSTSRKILSTDDGKTPIGIKVIPANFLGEGEKARYVSLKYMSYTYPDTGSSSTSNVDMYWGDNTQLCSGEYYDKILDNYSATLLDLSYDYNYFVNNVFSWKNTPGGTNPGYASEYGQYQGGYTDSDYVSLISSAGIYNTTPYIWNNGTATESSYSLSGSILGDISGKNHTATILEKYTAEDYKTKTSLTNDVAANICTAAGCTWRYHTTGTNQGDWYLPAAGELALMLMNAGMISSIMYELNQIYSSDCISQIQGISGNYGINYWSSTEISSSGSRVCWIYLSAKQLQVYNTSNNKKASSNRVLAFIQYPLS